MIQNMKEIADHHNDEDVYAMLKECSIDPNETTQKLLLQGGGTSAQRFFKYLLGILLKIKREIFTMKLIKHPNAVQIYELEQDKDILVLEFVDDEEIFDKILNLLMEARSLSKTLLTCI
ncbi:hypothetical protein Cni_G09866 [Canna indica]|uniref:GBF-interacting protein 1 N-terminal domain-containing protein n=1 Tax=Canna indica TaxID=4628 RepID=A0AAQ3K3E7_9LILI|nr:hypothetical protein Cni_G09866 [Canna indica]